MPSAIDVLDAAIAEATEARALVARVRAKQVTGADNRATLKTVGYAWFRNYRPVVETQLPNLDLSDVDQLYRTILESTTKHASKSTYLDTLKDTKSFLTEIRSAALTAPQPAVVADVDDEPPDFSPLVAAPEMREVLNRRWDECRKCVKAEAHLAAIVMMGGLLEAMFVARANKMADKKPLVNAAAAPKDRTTGKTLNYQEWMLDSYIKVGHELKWISDAARQVADVLKEFRNYIHPEKELRHGLRLEHNDSAMFWTVTKSLVRQLLLSAKSP